MKIIKISLATALALSLFGNIGFAAEAQTLEEAIKETTFNGLLRYRLNSDSYDNQGGTVGNNNTHTTHQYRAFGQLQTAPIKDISLNLGALYINEGATTGTGTTGSGLGAGSDGAFGVASFYATIAPKQYTTTSIMLGKQIIDTPLTYATDYDRGTGVLITNQDIANFTFVGAAFDTWSLSDMYNGGNDTSVSKALLGVAAIYTIPDLMTAQLWFFNVADIADSVLFADVTYNQDLGGFIARASASYGLSTLNTDTSSLLAGQESDNDLLKLNVGATLGAFVVDMGYLMNTKPGYTISFDDSGKIIDFTTMGQTWWQDSGTRTSIGLGRRITGATSTTIASGGEDNLSVLYGSVGAKNIADTGLGIHLTYVKGSADYKLNGVSQSKRDFQEIIPLINYQYNPKLSFQTFYSMLSVDINDAMGTEVTEKRNRYRFQAMYKF